MPAAISLLPSDGQGSRASGTLRPPEKPADPLYRWLMSRACGDPVDSHLLACVISARANEPDGDLADLLGLDTRALGAIFEQAFPGSVPDWRESPCLRLALHARAGTPFHCDHCGRRIGALQPDGQAARYAGTATTSAFLGEPAPPPTPAPSPREEGDAERRRRDASIGSASGEVAGMEEECEDIRALLLEHAAPDRPEAAHLASILARTCLRSNHLWEDLGLRDRGEVAEIMRRNFPSLAALNIGGRMRWKKFFYRQLCKRAQIGICRSPNCQSCDEYPICFSPEQSTLDQADGLSWSKTHSD